MPRDNYNPMYSELTKPKALKDQDTKPFARSIPLYLDTSGTRVASKRKRRHGPGLYMVS